MKKFYTLALAALAALGVNAANLTMTANGTPVQNGDRVDLNPYWDENASQYNPHLMLTSATGGAVDVALDFYKNDSDPTTDDYLYGADFNVLCCLGTECKFARPGQTLEVQGNLQANTPTNLQTELQVMLGDEQQFESLKVDAEFSMTLKQGDETMVVYFYAQQNTSGIEGIEMDAAAPARYYDMQGREVQNPESGLYIKRQGSKAVKVLL